MDKNDNIVMISKDIRANERYIRERLADCGDIQIRKMRLGDERKVDCLMVYIEVATSNMMLEDSALGKMVGHFWEISPGEMQEFVEYNSLGIADIFENGWAFLVDWEISPARGRWQEFAIGKMV